MRPASTPPPAGKQPPQVTMGLLPYLTSHSLDEDYAHVSERNSREPDGKTARSGASAMVILGLFGLLVATAALQTSRTAVDAQDGREALVTQIQARSAQVEARREQVAELRSEVSSLESVSLETTAQGRSVSGRLSRLGVQTGAVSVTGPGVQVIVDDAPNATSAKQEVLDRDLQKLVNALWLSGAEAISINGQRLTTLSAIRHAGSAITVNYRSLSRPYVVSAIGDPDSMPARFVDTRHGSAWFDLEAAWGLRFDMTPKESLTLPPANSTELRFAASPETTR